MIDTLDCPASGSEPPSAPTLTRDVEDQFIRLQQQWGHLVRGKSVADIVAAYNLGAELRAAMQRYATWSAIQQRNTLLSVQVLESIGRRLQNGHRPVAAADECDADAEPIVTNLTISDEDTAQRRSQQMTALVAKYGDPR